MTGTRKGEVRRAPKWHYVGHEATGDRPSLVISPDWFNDDGFAIIAPLTTPSTNHGYWWEPYISSTVSVCLVPDARTVPVRTLGRSVEGHATPNEMDDVLSAFDHLTKRARRNVRRELQPGRSMGGKLLGQGRAGRQTHHCMAMTSIVSRASTKHTSGAVQKCTTREVIGQRKCPRQLFGRSVTEAGWQQAG